MHGPLAFGRELWPHERELHGGNRGHDRVSEGAAEEESGIRGAGAGGGEPAAAGAAARAEDFRRVGLPLRQVGGDGGEDEDRDRRQAKAPLHSCRPVNAPWSVQYVMIAYKATGSLQRLGPPRQ